MLNRTNRKLSAKNLGLNLGTRMLAVKAGVNFGKLALHTVARPQLARAGGLDPSDRGSGDPIMQSYLSMSTWSATVEAAGSSPRIPTPIARGLGSRDRGPVAALASPGAASPRPAGTAAHRGRFRFRPEPSRTTPLESGRFGTVATAWSHQRPEPCAQVPVATP